MFRAVSRCVASHKGLLCLDLYKEIWVTNPVTGAVRALPCFRSLIKGDTELSGRYSSSLSSAFLQVADDGQSYTLLGVCKTKAGGESLSTGPARIVRYLSSSSSWTLLPSQCEKAAEGIDLTLCDLCCNCAFSDGQVFGLARDRGPGFSYFLASFDVEAMRWKSLCKLEQDFREPKQVVVCNSCIMVVVQSWEESWKVDLQRLPRIVVLRHDPAEKAMVSETTLPGIDNLRGMGHFFANGPLLCIIVEQMATYSASTRKWRNASTKKFRPWTFVNRSFTRGPAGGIFPPCAFELGLSTPV